MTFLAENVGIVSSPKRKAHVSLSSAESSPAHTVSFVGFVGLVQFIPNPRVCFVTSKLLLPVAGDLAPLGLDGLLAVGTGASSLPGAESTVALIGHADAPLPFATV